MSSSGELNCEELDRLVIEQMQHCDIGTTSHEEELRALLLAGDFASATAALRRHCPALADNQWLLFQMKKYQFMRLASLASSAPPKGSSGSSDDQEKRAHQLQAALDLARQELAPMALDAYVEAFSEFKHCMLALLSGGCSSNGGGGSGSSSDVGAGTSGSELREFAGMVARAVRQESGPSEGPPAGAAGCSGLPQLLRYLLLLHQHQHHSGFHPYWWPTIGPASLGLCQRLLLPQRDALPPGVLFEAGERFHAGGVREHDVQALRTSLGCDREEAVALLRRSRGSAFRALQDALQATHVDEALLKELAEEYASSRGLEPLPAMPSEQRQAQQAQQEPVQQQQQGSAAAPSAQQGPGPSSGDAMEVEGPAAQQQHQWQAEKGQESSGEGEEQQHQRRPSKVSRKEGGSGGGIGGQGSLGAIAAVGADASRGEGAEVAPLELPAELSEQQLRQLMRQLDRQLSAGQADAVLQQLQQADPSFLPDHPAVAFALHRCRFLRQLATPGSGMPAALAVVRQHLSPLAQQHPELLQPQLKAALAQLLPLPAGSSSSSSSSSSSEAAAAAQQQQQQQGIADALAAMRAALRPRCHMREPRLMTLLRDLLSLHAAHFKLQRCQDRFAVELGIPALKATPAAPCGAPAATPAAAAPSTAAAAAAAAAMAAEAGEALAAAGAVAGGAQQRPGDVLVPGVRVIVSDSDDEDMQEGSDEEDEEEDEEGEGVGVSEQAILTICEFTGLPRHTAIELLLVHGGDAEVALAHFFP